MKAHKTIQSIVYDETVDLRCVLGTYPVASCRSKGACYGFRMTTVWAMRSPNRCFLLLSEDQMRIAPSR